MFKRVSIMKFPDITKAKLYVSIWKTDIIPALEEDPNCSAVDLIDIGEGKIMGIATYNNKEQFKETNKWLFPKVMDYIKSLDGVVESIPGEILASWRKDRK